MNKISKKLFYFTKDLLLIIFILTFSINLIFNSKPCKTGILNGINFCGNILIPTLFPFMFLSSFIIKSGISKKIGKILSPIISFIFNLPNETSSIILISFIGGYPVGGTGISTLLENKNINQEESERMLNFCVCAGPAFILNFLGTEIIHNQKIANVIYISQIISGITIGIVLGVYSRFKQKKNSNKNIHNLQKNKQPKKNAFIESCISATNSIITMCALVIIFSSIISIINELNLPYSYIKLSKNTFLTTASIFLEVTNACLQINKLNNAFIFEILSFAIGFAGISVHMQIASQFENFNYKKFIIFRFIHGIFSSILTKIILNYSNIEITAYSNINYMPKTELSGTFLTSGLLIFLCIYFIFSVETKKINYEIEPVKPSE